MIDFTGKEVLVIAGGPSVTVDLTALRGVKYVPDVVLSANDHGLFQRMYPVDYLVAISEIHQFTGKAMQEYLSPYQTPVIARYPWADHRLEDWSLRADCGLTAIAVAARYGARRVVVTGVDGFRVGPRYFHGAQMHPGGRLDLMTCYQETLVKNLMPFIAVVCECPIRPVSGYLTRIFTRFET